jgi:hypothetical protein
MSLEFDKENHIYRIGGVVYPSVTDIIGYFDLDGLNKVPADVLEVAAEFGKYVHEATELYDKGILDRNMLDPKLKPYVEAWAKFLSEHSVRIKETEFSMYHPALNLPCTIDRAATMTIQGKRRFAIIDIKSSVSLPKCTRLQLAAYQMIRNVVDPDYKATHRVAVHLKPNGDYKGEVYKDKMDLHNFLHAYSLYNLKKNWGIL